MNLDMMTYVFSAIVAVLSVIFIYLGCCSRGQQKK